MKLGKWIRDQIAMEIQLGSEFDYDPLDMELASQPRPYIGHTWSVSLEVPEDKDGRVLLYVSWLEQGQVCTVEYRADRI